MDVPGLAAALDDPKMRERAEKEAERLLDELKKSVQVDARDAGVLRKELHITVPAKSIGDHLQQSFNEIVQDAHVPGFRRGRAPRTLVEKRFGNEVRDSLKTTIIGQSFFAAVENQKLDVLGDPLFRIPEKDGVKLMEFGEAVEKLSLPASGNFTYECEVELKPAFELPELDNIPLKRASFEITDELINEQIERQRRIRGRFEPLSGEAADNDDLVIADVTLRANGQDVKSEDNVQLGVRAARLDGIPLLNLADAIRGAKPGDVRKLECEIPQDYERADLRGQKGEFEFRVHEVKRLRPVSLEEYMESAGYATPDELRTELRASMEDEREQLVKRSMREQVYDYLLQQTPMEIPEQLSARQTDRAVVRRVIELQRSGVPMSDIEARIDELRTSAREQVARDLKLGFILEKIAAKLELRVTEEEVNAAIMAIARSYNKRFDRVRDDLQAQGTLAHLSEQIQHDKAIDLLLSRARINEE